MRVSQGAQMTRKKRDLGFSLLLLLPAVVITTIFILVPVIDSVRESFLDYKMKNIISGRPGEWNNFANYIKLTANAKLGPAIVHTFLFCLVVVFAPVCVRNGTRAGAQFRYQRSKISALDHDDAVVCPDCDFRTYVDVAFSAAVRFYPLVHRHCHGRESYGPCAFE